VCAALLERGHTELAVEDPCLWLSREAIERTGLGTPALAVDDDGADPGTLAPTTRAALLTPANQMPLGATLSPARRTAFVRWADDVDGLVIEDDYDGELRYDRQPAGALQGLDPDRVVYAGTTSKSLAPGLRLGWVVGPASIVTDLVERRRRVDRQGGVFEQATLAELLRSGRFDRHVRRQRARYRRRRDVLLRALAEAVPTLRPRGIAAGIHVVVELPWSGPSERSVVAGLADRGIAVGALRSAWQGGGRRRGGLVIGYGAPPEHAYAAAVRALARALAELTRTART
jgi:GntR family transcriptional regulator/MocR family aminotransferase